MKRNIIKVLSLVVALLIFCNVQASFDDNVHDIDCSAPDKDTVSRNYYYEYGVYKCFLKKYNAAIEDLTKSLTFDPDYTEAYILMCGWLRMVNANM